MGERLDHAQSLDHLLDIAVHVAQGGLLLPVIVPALAPQPGEEEQGKRQNNHRDEEQKGVGRQHDDHQSHEHQGAGDQGDQALFQGGLHVVRVVGKAAHKLPVGVPVKVGERQRLQLVEQIPAQLVHAALGQPHHGRRLGVGGRGPHRVDAKQLEQGEGQPREVPAAGVDEVVDDGPQQIGAAQIAAHRDEQAEEHPHQGQLVTGQIGEQAADGLLHILGLLISAPGAAAGPMHGPLLCLTLCHASPTPSC